MEKATIKPNKLVKIIRQKLAGIAEEEYEKGKNKYGNVFWEELSIDEAAGFVKAKMLMVINEIKIQSGIAYTPQELELNQIVEKIEHHAGDTINYLTMLVVKYLLEGGESGKSLEQVLAEDKTFCTKCGGEILSDSYCPQCAEMK